jgi:hypothetical protein
MLETLPYVVCFVKVIISTIFLLRTIFLSPRSIEGASSGDGPEGGSEGRRPLLRLVTAGSGGPGQPSAGIMTGCLQWLDAAGTKAGGSPPDKGRQKRHPLLSRPEATAPGTEIAAPERREATRLCAKGARAERRGWRQAPLGAPAPSLFRGSTPPALPNGAAGDSGQTSGAFAPRERWSLPIAQQPFVPAQAGTQGEMFEPYDFIAGFPLARE